MEQSDEMQTPEGLLSLVADLEADGGFNETLVEGISNMPLEDLVDYLEHTLTHGEAAYDGLSTSDTLSESGAICLLVIQRQRNTIAGVLRWIEQRAKTDDSIGRSRAGDSDL